MNLNDVVRDLENLPRDATIYVALTEDSVGGSTPTRLVLPREDPGPGWRYLLEVVIACEVVEVWSVWRDSRVPSTKESCEAIVYYALNDAYLDSESW